MLSAFAWYVNYRFSPNKAVSKNAIFRKFGLKYSTIPLLENEI